MYLDSSNWDSFKKNNEVFILGISDSLCRTCCQNEPFLKKLQTIFHEGKFKYKGKKIPIARIDVSKKHAFMVRDDIMFETMPKIVICKDLRFFIFDGFMDREEMLLH